MSRLKRLFAVAVAVVLVAGVVALATPVNMAAKPIEDPNCRRPCPPTKKHNGYTCTFAGCDTVTGACIYAC